MFHHPACNSFTVFHLTSDELNKPHLLLPCILCRVDVLFQVDFARVENQNRFPRRVLRLLFSTGFSVGLHGLLAQVLTPLRQFHCSLTSCETTTLHFPNQRGKFRVSLSP